MNLRRDKETKIYPPAGAEREEKLEWTDHRGLSKDDTIYLQVRVVEAAGLLRSTNFASPLKTVTIHKPFCAMELRNVTGRETTTSIRKTKHAKRTLFPMWDETVTFHIDHDDAKSKISLIRLHVQGYDLVHPKDMGLVDIRISDIYHNCNRGRDRCFQDWFQLDKRTPPKESVAGKIFVVFRMHTKQHCEENPKIPIFEMPESKENEVELFIGTMNCGNAQPPDPEQMEEWLQCDPKRHKIVVVGLQESVCGLSNEEQVWEDAILKAINKKDRRNVNVYETLARHSLTEMRIYCFVDQVSLRRKKVCHVSMFNEATGIGGVYGNKGATLISLDYGGTSFCFANSHLAAHQTMSKRRNENYREICTQTKGIGNIKQDIVDQFHHVFWLGDLNYRCNYGQEEDAKDSPDKDLFDEYNSLIVKGSLKELLEKDQLSQLLNAKNDKDSKAFFGFKEGEIKFRPTFKVFKGIVQGDKVYQPKRTPAWCDRILWRSAPEYEVTCTNYNSVPVVDSSDHKPVYGEYCVKTWDRQPGKTDSLEKKKVPEAIEFQNCQITGLCSDISGFNSEVCLHFPRQELIATHIRFARRRASDEIDPEWNDIQNIELQRTNPRFLENALLLFQCRDFGRNRSTNSVASGYLSLKPLVEEFESDGGNWVDINQKLTFQGISGGVLTGKYRLV